MLNFNFNFAPLSMVPTYKQEYDYGWINKATVRSYVTMGIIKPEDYTEIVGEPYAQEFSATNQR